jgi:Tol biopolymer transport system component
MGIYKNWVQKNTLIPWRFRHSLEAWLETSCWHRHPRLYRWIHFGQFTDPVHQVTSGPRHHFFGYYEKSPWNAAGNLLLAHEADFNDRPPCATDSITVGMVHLDDNNRFIALGESQAWNWQQGTMLQWHPTKPDQLLHNDRRNGRFLGVLRDTEGQELTTYEQPIYAITPDGEYGYSLNFARLYTHRPGYGYAGGTDPWANETHPRADGIHRMNLSTGESELILSLHQLAQLNPRQDMHGMFHWINHIQVAPDSSRIAFFHIWRVGDTGWRVRLYTADPDGSRLNCLLDTDFISHYDWLDDQRIMVWAKDGNSQGNFLLCDDNDNSKTIIGEGVLTEDGHCSFSPDRRWVLNDTYPDTYGMRTLMLYRWRDGKRIDLARLYSPKERWWGEIRCDLHPRWNRNGSQICVDSVHNGERQMHLIDILKIATARP